MLGDLPQTEDQRTLENRPSTRIEAPITVQQ